MLHLPTCLCALSLHAHACMYTHTHTCYSLSICRAEMIDTPWAHWVIMSGSLLNLPQLVPLSQGCSVLSCVGSCFTLTSETVNQRTVLSTCLEKESHFVTLCALHFGHSKLTGLYFPTLQWFPLEVSGAFVFALDVISCDHTEVTGTSSPIPVWVFLWPYSPLVPVRQIPGFSSYSVDLPSAHTDV